MLAAVRVGAPPHVQQAEAGRALKHRAVARLERLAPMSDQPREGHIHREAGQRDRPACVKCGAPARFALEPAHDGRVVRPAVRLLARRRGRRRGRLVGRLGSPAACRNHHTHPSFVGRERGVRPDGMRPDAVSEPVGAVRREHTHPRDGLAVSEPAAARVVEEEHGAKRQPAAPAQALKVRPFVARVDLLVRDEVRKAATGVARHFKRVE
mmetsp:Transcript_10507/g.33419  ORF Transcript_10507/g.33419 Transcript_10507/m.33419 type:complete len:210 (-) Transcript_10507:330-959(-)